MFTVLGILSIALIVISFIFLHIKLLSNKKIKLPILGIFIGLFCAISIFTYNYIHTTPSEQAMFLSECSAVEIDGKIERIHNKERLKDIENINTNNVFFYDVNTRQIFTLENEEYKLYEKDGYGYVYVRGEVHKKAIGGEINA